LLILNYSTLFHKEGRASLPRSKSWRITLGERGTAIPRNGTTTSPLRSWSSSCDREGKNERQQKV